MKRLFLSLLVSCSFLIDSYAWWNVSKSHLLQKEYQELLGCKDSAQAQKDYFNAFPDTWVDFIRMEYDLKENGDIYGYIKAFSELSAINDSVYCIKLFNLCNGADYDSDSSNLLHAMLHREMKEGKRLYIMLWLLAHVKSGDVMRFWEYYWSQLYFEESDGIHNGGCKYDDCKGDYDRLRNIIKKGYPAMVEPFSVAYKYYHHGVFFIGDPYPASYWGIKTIDETDVNNCVLIEIPQK